MFRSKRCIGACFYIFMLNVLNGSKLVSENPVSKFFIWVLLVFFYVVKNIWKTFQCKSGQESIRLNGAVHIIPDVGPL